MTHKQRSKYQQQGRTKATWTQRFSEVKSKVITFYGRTWENLCRAIEMLKMRYRRTVTLLNQVSMGAGLYSGSIKVC